MADAIPGNVLLHQVYAGSGPDVRFQAAALAKYPFVATDSWPSSESLEIGVGVLTSAGGAKIAGRLGHSATIEKAGVWAVYLDACGGWWDVQVASTDEAQCAELLAALLTIAPRVEVADEGIPLTIWTENLMSGGGRQRWATMEVGPWDEVAGNYCGEAATTLGTLSTGVPAVAAGGLIVFTGLAGTGKTRAVEGLLHSWKGTADLHYIVDTDKLLGSATYLADVLSSAAESAAQKRRAVVVAEDADELLLEGPKSPQVAKLLNVADGLLGRALGGGVSFLLTANAPKSALADYITRPGRAASIVEFEAFDQEAGQAWLTSRGIDHELEGEATLAELFQLTR